MKNFRCSHRVVFEDTDMSGFVHFSRILIFVEVAEHQMFQDLVGNPFMEIDGHTLGWPRLKLACNYKSPFTYGDVAEVELKITRVGSASISYDFSVTKDEQLAAEGSIVIGCCVKVHNSLQPVPIPAQVIKAFER